MHKDNVIQQRISSSDKEKLKEIAEKRHLKISELLDNYIQKLIKEDFTMYKIKELETNVVYDDIYASIEEAQKQINEYIKDDNEARNVTYEIINV